MNSSAAVAAALSSAVDAIGLVFSPSVRQVAPAQAASLAAPARGRVTLVAVTRHPSQALVDAIIAQFRPDALQTDLADFDALQLPQSLARLPVVRTAVAPGAAAPSRLLFEGARSGSGEPADWDAAGKLARSSELILAGGLHAGNVALAIERVRPHGVDVSSGVESAPGCKSAQLIDEFVQAARAGFRARQRD
ncbi:MAG TPA: phosphoribosylanthranilate isomerase [Steroidobacteraceae bacterium]